MNDMASFASLAEEMPGAGALAGVRVIDMSGLSGQYAGKLFADLGADVILVEPVHGSPVRRQGPFLQGRAHLETGLPFAYLNSGKRGIALDADTRDGQDILRKLIGSAAVLIESDRPGVMEARGLGYEALRAVAPRLIMTSITPFGQSGPLSQYASDDITALAMGGLLSLAGYPGLPPTAAHGNQAYLAAAQFAAIASSIALWGVETQEDGTGTHIDVSIQECVTMATENAIQFYDLEGVIRKRESGSQRVAGSGVFDCADGQVYLMAGGIASSNFWDTTVRWLIDEGVAGAATLLESQWYEPDFLASDEAKAAFTRIFQPFASARSKEWLYHAAQALRIPMCPINSTRDLVANRQLAAREFFVKIPHAFSGASLLSPGAPYRMSATPWKVQRSSPRLGEQTHEILSELGVDPATQEVLFKAGVIN